MAQQATTGFLTTPGNYSSSGWNTSEILYTQSQQYGFINPDARSYTLQLGGTMFDEKKPFLLINSTCSPCGWFASEKLAHEEAERRITADKSQSFIILKAVKVIEPEPVKTRVREVK